MNDIRLLVLEAHRHCRTVTTDADELRAATDVNGGMQAKVVQGQQCLTRFADGFRTIVNVGQSQDVKTYKKKTQLPITGVESYSADMARLFEVVRFSSVK